jgi:hypothetical protein
MECRAELAGGGLDAREDLLKMQTRFGKFRLNVAGKDEIWRSWLFCFCY